MEEEVEEVKRAIRDIVRMDIRSLSQKKKGGSSSGGSSSSSSSLSSSSFQEGEEEKKQFYSFRFDETKVEVEYLPSSSHCLVSSVSLFFPATESS